MFTKPKINEFRSIVKVINAPIDVLSWESVLAHIFSWSSTHQSKYICITNVHSVITSYHNENFNKVLREADLVTPDGFPIAWMLRRLGHKNQQRINGPDLMWRYCAEAACRDESIYLYGGEQRTLDLLQQKLLSNFPGLKIAGAYSPPYRNLTSGETASVVEQINKSGAGSVWVSLGCPKQEIWMAEQRGNINAVMIGVGAAFDYHAGVINRAPLWMQQGGFEWFYRLCSEPRRLWRRYFLTNSLFIVLAFFQLLSRKD